MVAGASGTAVAAVALAFTLHSSAEQDKKLQEQSRAMAEELETLKRIEALLVNLQPKPADQKAIGGAK